MYKLSRKFYKRNFAGKVLLYNPEAIGNPVLINRDIGKVLDRLSNSSSIKEILSLMPSSMPLREKRLVLSFLMKYRLIQSIGKEHTRTELLKSKTPDLEVWLHITNNCNLCCPYCFVRKSEESLSISVADRFVYSLMDGLNKHGFNSVKIKFSGGEPLLRLDLMKHIIDKMKKFENANVNSAPLIQHRNYRRSSFHVFEPPCLSYWQCSLKITTVWHTFYDNRMCYIVH